MFRKILNRFLQRRHYWRDINFDELSELYTSMMFRSLAMSLVGIFIPVYLYHLDYAIWQIFFFYAVSFSTWAVLTYPNALLIAKVGPKHVMLASYVAQVISMLMMVSLEGLRWPLASIAIILGISNCLFFTAFHVDFSKVKHKEHGGKELGWMISMQKLGAVLGPILGGLVAYFTDAQYIFALAIVLLFAGIIPLFLSQEPTALNQKLDFKGLDIQKISRDLLAQVCFSIENVASLIIWPLFISIYILKDNPYVQLGSITSISVLVSLIMARAIGRTIDKRKGRPLLRLGASVNAVLHLFRPFTSGFPMALGINLVNEMATPAYYMPFVKGMYDAADDLPGKRIIYITAMESVSAMVRAIFCISAGLTTYLLSDGRSIFIIFFLVGGLASAGIMLEKFKALNP